MSARRRTLNNRAGQAAVEYAFLCLVAAALAYPLFGLFARALAAVVNALNQSIGLAYP